MASCRSLGSAILALLLMATVTAANASATASTPATPRTPQFIDFTNAVFIQTSGATSIPYAAAELCHRLAGACPHSNVVQPAVRLNEALWHQLLTVNAYFNTTIQPMTDMDQYHVADFWTYPDSGYGDCEDYQLAKQRELIRQGWPASDLLMTIVLDQHGEGHAVLLVRTDRGDYVLDNQDGLIRLWSDTPYRFLKRQSQADASIWVGLIDSHQTVIVAKR